MVCVPECARLEWELTLALRMSKHGSLLLEFYMRREGGGWSQAASAWGGAGVGLPLRQRQGVDRVILGCKVEMLKKKKLGGLEMYRWNVLQSPCLGKRKGVFIGVRANQPTKRPRVQSKWHE